LDCLLGKQRGSANHEGFQRKFINGHYSDDWILIRSLVFFQSRFEAGTNVIGWVYGVGCNPGYDDLYKEYLWIDLTFFARGLKKKNAGYTCPAFVVSNLVQKANLVILQFP
jgi:hypothetical protein